MQRTLALAIRRPFCTAAVSATRRAATETWHALQDIDWVDRESDTQELLVEQAARQVEAYRNEYDAANVAEGEGKATYDQMEALYQLKEAAGIVDSYAEFINQLIRKHEDMVGAMGNNTTNMPEGGAEETSQTIREYIDFVNGLENKEVKKKVKDELGGKIVVLKMVLSAENFSVKFSPVAGGDFITDTKK